MRPLDPAIQNYYARAPEESRLESGVSLLEALRTRELIERFAPAAPATVLDVGGAAGAYGLWLASLGYSVHLVDLSPRLVGVAQLRSRTQPRSLASCHVGDARALCFPDDSVDVVLLLGPLYHLTDQDDRVRALREVARVLRPGGLVLAAAISRWASTLDGLTRGHFTDPNFVSIVEQALKDGQHRNVTDRLEYFTTAYFHRPDELLGEVEAADLALLGLYGLEGPGWLLPDLGAWLDQASSRETLLTLARLVEADPSTLSLSAHWLAVARKPLPSAAS